MERVKKGEDYWFIDLNFEVTLSSYGDQREPTDNWLFNSGNYFATEEEAESMAKKLRAVLKGADVIEMPNKRDMTNEEKSQDIIFGWADDVQECAKDAAMKMAEWKDTQFKEYLKKKIHTIESMKDIDTILPTDTAVVRTIKEIINEFFGESSADNSEREE